MKIEMSGIELKNVLVKMNDFVDKFPMLSWDDINLIEWAKSMEINYGHVQASIYLLDGIHTLNQNSEKVAFAMDLATIKKIKVKKEKKICTFTIYDQKGESFKFKHLSER